MPKLPSRAFLASSSIFLFCLGSAQQGCGGGDSRFGDDDGDDDGGGHSSSGQIIGPSDSGTSNGGPGSSGDAAIRPLTISPANAAVKVKKINGVVTLDPGNVTFTATRDGVPVSDAKWFLQQGELGAIGVGTGVFVPNGNGAGQGTIIATANGGTGQAVVAVSLEGEQNGGKSDGTPDEPNCATFPGGCGGVGGEPLGGAVPDASLQKLKTQAPEADQASFSYLYPYEKTVFPRGILAPLMQWEWSKTATAVAVKITSPGVTFTGYYAYAPGATADAKRRIRLDQAAWRSALNANDGSKFMDVELTLLADDNKVYGPFKRQLIVSPSPLTGTVYYNSYDSRLTGQGVTADASHPEDGVLGGVLSIKISSSDPSVSATPQVALPLRTPQTEHPNDKKCTACHVVSANGSTMFVQDGTTHDSQTDSSDYGHSLSFDLTQPAQNRTEQAYSGADDKHKFTWAAPYPDGSFALSSSKITREARRTGNSGLWSKTDGSAIPADSFAAIDAVTPAFAPDGSKVAFSLWSGAVGTANAGAHTLVAMDFACGALPGNPACATGSDKKFSGGRSLYTAPDRYPAWPSFLPDASGVVFNNGFGDGGKDQASDISGGFTDCVLNTPDPSSNDNCFLSTWYRATSEVWLAPDGGDAVILGMLNGAGYLPVHTTQEWAHYFPTPDQTVVQKDWDDSKLNYMPTVNPVPSGGYFWVVFTSRRRYGSVLAKHPFYENALTQYQHIKSAQKKLWVAAIDANTGAVDRSHPAFYLPGQELDAGNSRGFWVVDPCHADGATCETGDQCCGGTCRTDAASGGLTCQPPPEASCQPEFNACKGDGDCCGTDLKCINGKCSLKAPRVPN